MDLQFTPEEEAFRSEVLQFLRDRLPERLSHKVKNALRLTREDMVQWHAVLHERGWLANHWPRQYGGPGWSAVQKFIFENECALAGAPRILPFGVNMLGPVLIKYGSEAQKQYWLPRILNGEDWWCQGYSEPGSGSDLASVKTSAVRGVDAQGPHYIVNGQKTWTTLGQHANMIFCLVRTNREAKKQEGITFILIDMDSPGVSVKPILLISGKSPFCETYFDQVRVPVANVIGEIDGGWTVAKALLGHERSMIADTFGGGAAARKGRSRFVELAERYVGFDEKGRIAEPVLRSDIAQNEMDTRAFALTVQRTRDAARAGHQPGPESSMFKIYATETNMRRHEVMVRLLGPQATGWEGAGYDEDELDLTRAWLRTRGNSIEGGTSEIQLNIIAKRVLGLPD